MTPQARDPGSSYTEWGAADVFEVWADVRRHYRRDPTWNAISGYSLGGLGTYKLAEQWPDLFAKAVAIVGSPGGTPGRGQTPELASLLQPTGPALGQPARRRAQPGQQPQHQSARRARLPLPVLRLPRRAPHLGLQRQLHRGRAVPFRHPPGAEPRARHVCVHPGRARRPEPAVRRLPTAGPGRRPGYWVRDVRPRTRGPSCHDSTSGCGTMAIVDALSHGFGVGDPPPSGTQTGSGVQGPGGLFPSLPYVRQHQTWGRRRPLPARTRLTCT